MNGKSSQEEIDLLEQATEFVVTNAVTNWNQEAHSAFLVKAVATAVPSISDEEKEKLFAAFLRHGLGGNTSQFAQWLSANDVLARSPRSANVLARYKV